MKQAKCLVISSGGLSGLAYLGVAHTLDLAGVEHFFGTSIGAIICCLLAIGMTPMQIFFDVCRLKNPFPQNWDKVVMGGDVAISTFARFEHELCGIFRRQLGFLPTFAQLHARRGKSLHVFAFSTETYKTVEFSPTRTPDVCVIDAVLASSSIPLVFPPRDVGGHLYIDGAFLCPIPLKFATRHAAPEEIVVIYSEPYKWGQYKRWPRFSLIFNILTLSLVSSHAKTVRHLDPEMKTFRVPKCDNFVLEDLALEDKWELFLSGYRCAK